MDSTSLSPDSYEKPVYSQCWPVFPPGIPVNHWYYGQSRNIIENYLGTPHIQANVCIQLLYSDLL